MSMPHWLIKSQIMMLLCHTVHSLTVFNTWSMLTSSSSLLLHSPPPTVSPGEICAFNIHGLEAPFEAVVLNGTSGEGQLRARGLVDCELQKEYTFIIQAHDCGSGPGGTEGKKSHKWVWRTEVIGTTTTTTKAHKVRKQKPMAWHLNFSMQISHSLSSTDSAVWRLYIVAGPACVDKLT